MFWEKRRFLPISRPLFLGRCFDAPIRGCRPEHPKPFSRPRLPFLHGGHGAFRRTILPDDTTRGYTCPFCALTLWCEPVVRYPQVLFDSGLPRMLSQLYATGLSDGSCHQSCNRLLRHQNIRPAPALVQAAQQYHPGGCLPRGYVNRRRHRPHAGFRQFLPAPAAA